jgi:anti-sigma factor RsiW
VTDSDRFTEAAVSERQVAVSDETAVETRELDHAEVRGLLSDYLEGTLEAPERECVRQHLDRCPPCRAFLRTLERTVDLTGRLPMHRLPDRVRREILDRLTTTADRSGGA